MCKRLNIAAHWPSTIRPEIDQACNPRSTDNSELFSSFLLPGFTCVDCSASDPSKPEDRRPRPGWQDVPAPRRRAPSGAPLSASDENALRRTEILRVRRPIVWRRWKCAASDGPLSASDENALRPTEILRVRRPVVWRRWKCAAYDGPLSASDGNALRPTEILRVRRPIVWRRWKCAAYDGPLSASDGNALRPTEILRVRRPIVWRRWKCAASDGPSEGGMMTIPASNGPDFIDGGDALTYSRISTYLSVPCTRMRCPSWISRVAFSMPTTAGRPYSRAITSAG